ncbi:MAG: hypothetical protein DDG60_01760 [Anaerolineae bacterium]|nr:MAG: hypothetical protein DDG60_01760 [Anaerolineae bacterium]
MKKFLLSVFVLLAMFTLTFVWSDATAQAAPREAKRSIKLTSIKAEGKRIVLRFAVVGKFQAFRGRVKVGNASYPLDCSLRNAETLVCAARHNGKIEGQSVSGAVNGFAFASKVPHAEEPPPTEEPCE